MKKLKLDLDGLRIDSFDTTPANAVERKGTVQGQFDTAVASCDGTCDNTCDGCSCCCTCCPSCGGTCETCYTCGTCPGQWSCDGSCYGSCGDTCYYSCGGSCDECTGTCPDLP
jgi:hypothetical protein